MAFVKKGFTANNQIDGRILTMMPLVNGTRLHLARGGTSFPTITWECGVNFGEMQGHMEMISQEYLPKSCKPDASVNASLKSIIENGDEKYKLREKVRELLNY